MRRHAVTVLLLTAVALGGGCAMREKICAGGEYPAKAVGSTTGRTCVPDGQAPPSGYVRYPEGQVPQHLDDEWDRYWRDKALDGDGRLVSPSPSPS